MIFDRCPISNKTWNHVSFSIANPSPNYLTTLAPPVSYIKTPSSKSFPSIFPSLQRKH